MTNAPDRLWGFPLSTFNWTAYSIRDRPDMVEYVRADLVSTTTKSAEVDLDALKREVLQEYGGNGIVGSACIDDIEWVIDYLSSKGHIATGKAEVDLDALKRECEIINSYTGEARNIIKAYTSALINYLASSGRIRGEWRPISEAPKDTAVLLYACGYSIGHFNSAHNEWWGYDGAKAYASFNQPTHFMPLPPAPGGVK